MKYIRCLGSNLIQKRSLSEESKCLKMILGGFFYIKGARKRDEDKPKRNSGAPCSEEMMKDSILTGE